MCRFFISLGVALLVVASATASHASIFVRISDGTRAVDGRTPTDPTTATFLSRNVMKLSKTTLPAGTVDLTDIFNLLTCAARPCTVHFPSGAATAQAGDTFRIQDVSATSLARVEKFDSIASADRVSFKGVKITSLTAGKVLTVTYGVQSGDLKDLTSTSTSYTGTAALTGTFKTATGLRATACKLGTVSTDVSDSCVKLSVALNGTTVNGAGSTAVATVSVPCNNAFPTVNPCGTNGSYTGTLGTFTGVNDSKSISCASPCRPTQVGTVTAEFNGIGDVLQLTASANGAMANVGDEAGGAEEVLLTLADELGTNRWVAYTAASERCRAVPKAPTTNDTRNITNNSNLPISFELWCGFFAPLATFGAEAGVDLVSIVDPVAEKVLAGSAAARNDAGRVGFLPAAGALQLKDISTLSLSYEVVVGDSPSGNSTLGDLAFEDCQNGSIRIELELRDSKGAPAGTAKVYLGSTNQFKSGCADAELTGTNLVNNPDARVDTSGLVGNLASPCCITFSQLQQGQRAKLIVRRISLVVDQGNPLTSPASYKVRFLDGNVNGITALSSLELVTGLERTFDLFTNGVSITITKLTGTFGLGIVKVIRSGSIVINGGKFTASVNVNELQPESGAQYTVSLCPNGAEDVDPNLPANTPLGLCIGDQAFMTLL